MRGFSTLLALLLIVGLVSFAPAEEKAATSELPPALAALNAQLVTADEAHDVRGQTGTTTDPATSLLTQTKSFTIEHGVATGSVNLLEGVFGNFTYVDFQNGGDAGTSLTVEGTFGGLVGSIGTGDAGLTFEFGGKAFQESFDFAGKLVEQNFAQTFNWDF